MKTNPEKINPAIVIMAKVPRAGAVKTRLQAVLSAAQCAELAVCFLNDTFAKAKTITPNVFVAFSPAEGGDEIEKLLPECAILIEQKGNDLGERMYAACAFAETEGFSPIIVLGTDSPNLPPDRLEAAIESFRSQQTKAILGAARDGGFYLVGLRESAVEVFENVEWSCAQTYRQTAENARRIFGAEPAEIGVWYDVDTPEDLRVLYQDFLKNNSFAALAPNTAKWLERNRHIIEK